MEWIGVAGIVVALVFFIVAAMKGYTVMLTAPITAIIIILTNQMDFNQFFFADPQDSYLAGAGSFVMSTIPIFILSAVFGKYIDASGAARSIASALMSKVGTNSPYGVLLGIAAITALFSYGGIAIFVVMFAIMPLAKPIFKECNIAWHLFLASFALGAASFTMGMIPGSPDTSNVITANGCGVTTTAAPVLGIIGSIVTIVLGCVYIKIALKRSQAKGEGYDCILPDMSYSTDNLPSLARSLTPIVVLIATILIGSAFKVPNIVYIAMTIAIVLSAVLFNRYINHDHKGVLGSGAQDSLAPVLFTAAAAGIGSVVAASSGFGVIQEAVYNMPGGPYVSAAVLSCTLGGIIGGGTAACGIMVQNFIGDYLALGVSAAVLYKVVNVAALVGGALPNAGSLFGMLNAMGLNHKNAYRHFFWQSVVIDGIALVVIIVLGTLGVQ